MIFPCINNQFIEFKIITVDIPARYRKGHDCWVDVFLFVCSTDKIWSAIDPAIEVPEYYGMIDWFRQLSQNEDVKYEGELSFMEPNLYFQLINSFDSEFKEIDIYIGGELNPSEDDYKIIRMRVNNEELLMISQGLDEEIKKFIKR